MNSWATAGAPYDGRPGPADRGPSRSRRATITMTADRAPARGLPASLARTRRDMSSPTPTPESESYLFVTGGGQEGLSPGTVFCRVADAELATSICRLCEREYGADLSFSHMPSSSFPPEEQVLLDEALDDLIIYDDPDPGIYDPPPTRQTLQRVECARRCQRWEEMLKNRRRLAGARAKPDPQVRGVNCAKAAECPLTDGDLLTICGIVEDDPELTTEHMADLRRVACLIGSQHVGAGARLELAMSLLASVLGGFPRHNPTHLPFGYQGPTIKSNGWLDRDILERTGKQIVGLLWDDCTPETVASRVEQAISEAARLGFLEELRYDAWRPGMPSGSGWRVALAATPYGIMRVRAADNGESMMPSRTKVGRCSVGSEGRANPTPMVDGGAGEAISPGKTRMPPEDRRVSALILLMQLAQSYYKILESVISMASWCAALDMELNESYLWVTTNLKNLIKNHEDLKDFPATFEPIFPNLYPTTIRDVDWEDMVAPHAEGFLSTVQQYVHDKGIYDPEEGSPAWVFIEIFRESINTAIAKATAYNKRMRQYMDNALSSVSTLKNSETESEAKVEGAMSADHEGSGSSQTQSDAELSKKTEVLIGERSGKQTSITSGKKPGSGPAVQLSRPGEACIVLGKQKKPLTDGQYAVVSALWRAGEEGMNKDAMEAIRPSARRILKKLREDPDWAEVILLPGQTNGRYRIRR